MRQQQSSGLVLFHTKNTQRLYLLLQYTNGGHWDFPKGKIEPNETKIEAALRELAEETGITHCTFVTNPSSPSSFFEETVSYTFTDFDGQPTTKTVFFFLAHTDDTDLTLSHEHTDAAWLTYTEAIQTLTYPNTQKILKEAHILLEQNNKQ